MIREKEIKAKRNNRKRPSLIQRKNEKLKKKRRITKCPALSGDFKSNKEVVNVRNWQQLAAQKENPRRLDGQSGAWYG